MSILAVGAMPKQQQQQQPRSRLQPPLGDPDNPPPEGTNAIAQARTPQARPSGLVSVPSHVPPPTVYALSTMQGDAEASPPTTEGGCVDNIANQTASRKQPRVGRWPRYNKSQTIQHVNPAGTANPPSLAISKLFQRDVDFELMDN